jgi:alkylation response protein AidB-like acyl-CoA dehydrogenase
MDFDLTADQQDMQKAAIDFARHELNDNVIERDESRTFSMTGWKKCAEFGVMRLPIPEEYGGSGAGPLTTIAVMEGLGYGCRDAGLLFTINAHLWTNSIPILKFGTAEQKKKYLPGLCDGSLIGANGASEPGAGSDIFGSMRTLAAKDDDGYVLNGSKIWVTNAPIADVFTCYATLDPKRGAMGVTGFVIEKGAQGLSISSKLDKMGLRTSPMAEIFFKDCRVPKSARLGREGFGPAVFNCSMAWERASILATCLGTMRRQLDKCIDYAQNRKQFGQPIGKFQAVAHRIVEMQLRYETARLLLYKVGWLMEQDKVTDRDAAMAKLFVSEAFVQSSLDAIQVHGAAGYMTEYELERELRDAIGSRLYSGTSEIQRNIIARGLLHL